MTEAEKRMEHSKVRFWITLAGLVVIGCWLALLIYGLATLDQNNTERRGQLGDSFGMLGGLFAGLAFIAAGIGAYFQWAAMRDERAAAAADAVESRFFQMVNSLQVAVNETRVEIDGQQYVGRQALRQVAKWLHDLKPCRSRDAGISDLARLADIRLWFDLFYDGKGCQLAQGSSQPAVELIGHIARLIYHILKYVNSSTAIGYEQKYAYASILRAHLSNPELVILFYNILSWHGYRKHFPLAAGYRMFKNIDLDTLVFREDWRLYQNLVTERREEIVTVVGRLPDRQIDTATKPDT